MTMTTSYIPTGTTENTNTTANSRAERIQVDNRSAKHLGHWTTATAYQVRARKGVLVLDLRSPRIAGDLDVHLDLRRSTLIVLLTEDAAIDQWELRFDGRGRVGDDQPPAAAVRRVRLHGAAADSQIRVRRGGVAQLTAMLSRPYLAELRRARRAGTIPTVDDPARGQA